MLSTGKSRRKSTEVVARLKLAVPMVLLEPNGLSAPDSAVDEWASNSRRRRSEAFHATFRPVDLFSLRVAKSDPAMARSPRPRRSGDVPGPRVSE